jgi:hypothetical protein
MKEFIGVKSWLGTAFYPSLKRESLMFNRIAIPKYKQCLDFLGKRTGVGEYYVAQLEWLSEQGFVFEPDHSISEKLLLNHAEFNKYYNMESNLTLEMIKIFKKQMREIEIERGDTDPQTYYAEPHHTANLIGEWLPRLYDAAEYQSRYVAVHLREVHQVESFPVLTTRMSEAQETQTSKTDVVHILLNALPEPDDATSWEQILDYRSDPDTAGKFLSLRNWMNEVVRGKLSPLEVEEKLEFLIYQYEQHVKLHKLKTNRGILESVVVASAEFLEDLVKFKWGKIAKGLFALKHRRVELMEGELKAPGNEIAYIVKAREQFS